MKNTLKKAGILWLMLMCGAWLVFTYWDTMPTYIQVSPDKPEHELHLHSLFLWENATDTGASWIKANNKNLDILNGLIVWTWSNRKSSSGHLITVWWWKDNVVKGNNSWIWGWKDNKINNANNSAIGWWDENTIEWWDPATIAWWQGNKANTSWVVVGWYKNTETKWVALWWSGNKANGENSLAMWINSKWGKGSFAWNDGTSSIFNAPDNTARIDANSGVLIWTFTPIKWVALVVSWAIKLGEDSSSELAWEMRVKDWCIQVYDGNNWHYLGGKCQNQADFNWCQFGKTYLLNGDTAIGYVSPVAATCKKERVKCKDWELDKNYFPYCYEISSDPEYQK